MKCLKITSPDELNTCALQNLNPISCSPGEETVVLYVKKKQCIHYTSIIRHLPHYESGDWIEKEEKCIELNENRFILWGSRPVGYLEDKFLIIFGKQDTYHYTETSSVNLGYEEVVTTTSWTLGKKTDRFLCFRENSASPMKSLMKLGDRSSCRKAFFELYAENADGKKAASVPVWKFDMDGNISQKK